MRVAFVLATILAAVAVLPAAAAKSRGTAGGVTWFAGHIYCFGGGKYRLVLGRNGYYFYTGGSSGTWRPDGENGFIATFPRGMTRRASLHRNAGGGITMTADNGQSYFGVEC
jgi:hypothetical protein